jgi:hypothetical protein
VYPPAAPDGIFRVGFPDKYAGRPGFAPSETGQACGRPYFNYPDIFHLVVYMFFGMIILQRIFIF